MSFLRQPSRKRVERYVNFADEISRDDLAFTHTVFVQLSLSRLNHRLPGCEAHPEVVWGTAACHHELTDALLPQADPVFDDATTLDTAGDMLDPQPTLVERLVGPFLLSCQLLAAGFLSRHEDLDLGQRARQKGQILHQPTPGR